MADDEPLPFPHLGVCGEKGLVESIQTFGEHQHTCTPNGPTVQTKSLDPELEEHHQILKSELGTQIEVAKAFASSLYHDLASDDAIKNFLAKTRLYNRKTHRWALPQSHANLLEEEMYDPLVKLINVILKAFGRKNSKSVSRTAVKTAWTSFHHKEPIASTHKSRPDISVKVVGPSFQLPESRRGKKKTIGYANIATFFEVKIENRTRGFLKELLQIAVYVRYASPLIIYMTQS
jgi:hypothetical protein